MAEVEAPDDSRHARGKTTGTDVDGGPPEEPRTMPKVLLVATLGGGGIHHYVEALEAQLEDQVEASIFDMRSNPKGSGLTWLLSSLVASALAALKFPLRSRPDIVHVHASQSLSFYRAAPYVFIAAHLWRRPVILHIHGSSFDEFVETDGWLRRHLQDAVYDSADRIIVLSPYWERTLAPHVDRDELSVIPNAVAVDRFEPTYDNDVPVIAFVSHLTGRKGVPELVEAVDSLTTTIDRPFQVKIAGTGEFEGAVRSLEERCAEVEYLGYVTEAEKRELLADSDIFVLPTHAEGLPIALLEGMAGGNAIVTTPVGSIPEVVDEQGAILVGSGSVEDLTVALECLLRSPDRSRAMGRHNRAIAEDRYAWPVVTKRVLETYRAALESPTIDSATGGLERASIESEPAEADGRGARSHRHTVHNEPD